MKVTLRKVLKKDWDYILKLRNEPNFSKFFYNQKKISKKEHYNYLEKQKKNSGFVNWIISYGKKDVGYVRILDEDVSIMIDQKFHSKGIGVNALKILEENAKNLSIKKLIGKMMIDNKSSQKIFLKNNFKLKMYWYEKQLS